MVRRSLARPDHSRGSEHRFLLGVGNQEISRMPHFADAGLTQDDVDLPIVPIVSLLGNNHLREFIFSSFLN